MARKLALIAGASADIGPALARAYAERGHDVARVAARSWKISRRKFAASTVSNVSSSKPISPMYMRSIPS